MEVQELVNLIMNSGVTLFMLAYFIYRDKTFMQKLDSTLTVINKYLEKEERDKKNNEC